MVQVEGIFQTKHFIIQSTVVGPRSDEILRQITNYFQIRLFIISGRSGKITNFLVILESLYEPTIVQSDSKIRDFF